MIVSQCRLNTKAFVARSDKLSQRRCVTCCQIRCQAFKIKAWQSITVSPHFILAIWRLFVYFIFFAVITTILSLFFLTAWMMSHMLLHHPCSRLSFPCMGLHQHSVDPTWAGFISESLRLSSQSVLVGTKACPPLLQPLPHVYPH